jgi:hypothetical protein
MPEPYDEQREDYASLAEEASDESAHPWNDKDWDAQAVKNAKKYAKKHNYSWPPGINDFDNWYMEHYGT